MNSNKQLNLLLSIMAAALCGAFCHTHAGSMGTAFTYQGRLVTSTGPASGSYELMFSLWDNQYYGTLIGTNTTCSPCSVTVTGGVFSVLLDFGPVFQGDLRWLEIAARPTGGGYVVLPRQPLTPAPNALYAARADAVSGLSVTSTPLEVQGERVDQSQSTGGSGLLSDASTIVWQSFTAGWSAHLVKVNVTVSGDREGGTFFLYDGQGIWAGGDFKVPLWSDVAALDGHQVIPGSGWPLVAGHKYTFAFWYPAGASLAASAGDTYAGGTAGVMQSPNAGDLAFTNVMSSYFIPNYQLGLGLEPDTAGTLSVNGPVTASSFAGSFTGNGAGLTNVTPADGSVTAAKLGPDSVTAVKLASDPSSLSKVSGGAMSSLAGNIGIGTNSPQSKLDVNGEATVNALTIRSGPGLAGGFHFGASTAGLPGLAASVSSNQVPAGLVEVVDQSQSAGGNSITNGPLDGPDLVFWQSFRAGVSGDLVEVSVNATNDLSTVSFMLYEGEGIEGQGLYSQEQANSATIRIPEDDRPYLTSGQMYTLFWYIERSGGNHWRLETSTNDAYANGHCAIWDYVGGAGFVSLTGDTVFSTTMLTESNRFIPVYQLGLGQQTDTAGALTINGPVTATIFNGDGSGLSNITPMDGSVTTAKLSDYSVTISKLADSSVSSDKLLANSVNTEKLQPNSVSTEKLQPNSVTAEKLASDASSLSKVSGGLMGNYSGNVGIGTNNPQYKLHVNGEAAVTALNITSDRNAKEQFATVEPRGVLNKVLRLPITSWQFKEQPGVRHLGPVAQDFYAAFDLGRDDQHIATVDADGVALAAIQGLNEKVDERDRQIARLRAENESLAARLAEIEKKLGLTGTSQPSRIGTR